MSLLNCYKMMIALMGLSDVFAASGKSDVAPFSRSDVMRSFSRAAGAHGENDIFNDVGAKRLMMYKTCKSDQIEVPYHYLFVK